MPSRDPLPVTEPLHHLHEPFLRGAAAADGRSSGHALGAFLTMRLVDQFSPDRAGGDPEALEYQIRSINAFLEGLHPATAEANHLCELVRIAQGVMASGNARLLWPPMLAYAYWLEHQLRLDEALDVLDTALRLSPEGEGEEEVAGHLQRARVLRMSSRYEEAQRGYVRAGELAERLGDAHSELLSRIGRAFVLQHLGNLPESERMLRTVLQEAGALGDRDAEARASHDLAHALDLLGRPAQSIPLFYRAFELYEQPRQKVRALHDLGIAFKDLCLDVAANHAFLLVLESNPTSEVRVNAMLELVELAARRGDRVTFERWRREAEQATHRSPALRVDYALKVGRGLGQFGNVARAEHWLRTAVGLAEEHGLNQYIFRSEQALEELRARDHPRVERAAATSAPALSNEVSAVAEGLEGLLAAARSGMRGDRLGASS